MARGIKKFFSDPESSSTLILVGGIAPMVLALAVAGLIMTHWNEAGIVMGRSVIVTLVLAVVGVFVAVPNAIWALSRVNRLSGSNSVKCITGYLLNAGTLAIIGAFILILRAFYSAPTAVL